MIPSDIRKLFWEIQSNNIDLEKNKKFIISRVLNYGTLSNWSWLRNIYGKDSIVDLIKMGNRADLREPSRKLATLIFVD